MRGGRVSQPIDPDIAAYIDARVTEERRRLYAGRTVLIPVDPGDNYGVDVAIGMVTHVLSSTEINCFVIKHGPYSPTWVEGITYVSSFDGLPDHLRMKRWTWTGGV